MNYKIGGESVEKQTKNVITRELIEKELRFYNKADLRSNLVLCGAFGVFFGAVAAGIIYGFIVLLDNIWLKIVLSVLVGGLITLPIWVNIRFPIISLRERKLLKNGDFDILVHRVQRKEERILHRHTQRYLHFEGFKATPVERINYDLVSIGDEFYIVHYKGHTSIKLLYSLKMY